MGCMRCSGAGCEDCDRTGRIQITGCPLEQIGEDVWRVIEYAELYEKGLPPVAGGALDQAHCFIEAARFIMQEQRYWKNKIGVIG